MGEEINVLNGGVELLGEIKDSLVSLDEMKEKLDVNTKREDELEKEIDSVNREMESEIASTVSKRRAEVEESFDKQIEATKERMRSIKKKRDKSRESAVSNRINNETAELQEEIRNLKLDKKSVFTKAEVPFLYRNNYAASIFVPGELADFIKILVSVVVVLALPLLIYLFLPEENHKVWILVLLYIGVVGIVTGIYILVFRSIHEKYLATIKQAKKIESSIASRNKRLKKKVKKIKNDSDESSYGLEKYDEELVALDSQVDDTICAKKQALAEFENKAKVDIINEIKARYADELEKLKTENESLFSEQKTLNESIGAKTLEISRKYEAYVGKEYLTVPMIEGLMDIINGGDALNIADALAFYKKQLNTKEE